jgi:hypothetical protein
VAASAAADAARVAAAAVVKAKASAQAAAKCKEKSEAAATESEEWAASARAKAAGLSEAAFASAEVASASAEAAVASAASAMKAAEEAAAKATAVEALAKEAALRSVAAAAAAQAAEAAAMGINWRSKMLERIANADADLPTVPWPKVPGSITTQCKDWGNPVIFADTPPTLLALRVPLGSKLEAVRILKTLGEYMGLGRVGDEHKGKFKFFERLRFSSRYMSPEDGGANARPNWFVIAESSVGAFRAAARENLEEMTRTVSESNVDKKKLEKASNDKTLLNCTACSSSLLAHDDPQFDVKVCVLADVCHGGFLKPCAKCRP